MVIAVTSDAGAKVPPPAPSAPTSFASSRRRPCRRRELGVDRGAAALALISKDGKTGLIVAGITGGESGAQKHAKALANQLVYDRDGVTVRASGDAMTYVQINGQSEKDLLLMESIAIR